MSWINQKDIAEYSENKPTRISNVIAIRRIDVGIPQKPDQFLKLSNMIGQPGLQAGVTHNV